jgi:lysophospholipase L1-like esterase
MYLALGDSLSEGVSASDEKRTAWVPLVAIGLGSAYELRNLGIAGLDSRELIKDGPLDWAQQEIRSRAIDAVPGNEVAAITLEIGGNDLLDLYFNLVLPGLCPSIPEALERPVCVNELRNALDEYGPNLDTILNTLQRAAPGVPIFLMTLYNPFSGGSSVLDDIGVLTLEGREGTPFPDGLNDAIRARAASHPNVVLVEWYDLFLGKQGEYISQDLIHPNDKGYSVMADAVLAAMRAAGLP